MENNKDETLTPRQLINKHLMDVHHVINEDEFRKLKVGSDEEKISKELIAGSIRKYGSETDESLTPRQLINKHMIDLNHVVNEDEFRKLKVGSETNEVDSSHDHRNDDERYQSAKGKQ